LTKRRYSGIIPIITGQVVCESHDCGKEKFVVNKQCARECIDYIMSYRDVVCSRDIALEELEDARREFNDTRMAQLKERIASFDELIADIEYTADNYTPVDMLPYRGNTFWLERAFLRCRFILGASLERTAEIMKRSRATVFRIQKYLMNGE